MQNKLWTYVPKSAKYRRTIPNIISEFYLVKICIMLVPWAYLEGAAGAAPPQSPIAQEIFALVK